MQKYLLLCFLLSGYLFGQEYINVGITTGDKQDLISNIDKITFSGDNIVFAMKSGGSTSELLADITRITFSGTGTGDPLENIRLAGKIFLEGPYDDGAHEMTTLLNSGGFLPLTSPYSEDARTVSAIPATITDWVLVQIRSTADGSAVISRSAFLRKDGYIVADDGTTAYIELAADPGDYYIVIKHRNHLAVESDEVHTLSTGSSTLYDFTVDGSTAYDKYYGGEAALLETGVYGMFCGDPNGSGGVNATDYLTVKGASGSTGYYAEDCNLSGGVNATDYLVIKPNSGKTTQIQ